MPELPEAETIVRGLRTPLSGRSVTRVEVLRPDLLANATPEAFRRGVTGRSFGEIGRRGKNLVLILDGGTARRGKLPSPARLVVNLGMSGRLLHRTVDAPGPPPTHPGVRFHLDDGSALIYHDPRRFGRLAVLSVAAFEEWSAGLGPEPLGRDFSPARLAASLAGSKAPIRSWLLDQRKVAGVGNIYANEALFRAGIDPRTPAGRINGEGAAKLHTHLREVLREAIRARGTTLRDYRTAEGSSGEYAVKLRVYGRDGEPCPQCGTVIQRLVFGGRSVFLCAKCQR